MKKNTIFIFIILLTISCLSGCSSNKQKTNSTNDTISEKIEQGDSNLVKDKNEHYPTTPTNVPVINLNEDNTKNKSGIEKVDVTDLKALQVNSFAYINEAGHVVIKNTKDKSEQTIISDGFVYDYDFNYKDNKITYIVGRDEDFTNTNAVIYDVNSKQRDVLVANTGIKAIGWSPSGKYIALTQGAGPGNGLVRIYDVLNKTWIKVPTEKGDGFEATDFKWNPSEDILALVMLIYPNPPSPIGNVGESFSVSVYYPKKDNSIKNIAKGSNDYGYDIVHWIDSKTLSIRKNNYKEPNDIEYYKANINNGSIVKVLQNKDEPLIERIPKEAYLYQMSLSSDGKLLLYSYGGVAFYPKGEMYLWDIEKQTKELICLGGLPKWIINNTVRAEGN